VIVCYQQIPADLCYCLHIYFAITWLRSLLRITGDFKFLSHPGISSWNMTVADLSIMESDQEIEILDPKIISEK